MRAPKLLPSKTVPSSKARIARSNTMSLLGLSLFILAYLAGGFGGLGEAAPEPAINAPTVPRALPQEGRREGKKLVN